MQLPPGARKYLLDGLTATPVVIDRLLEGADVDFDHRPEADRFTLREMMAHLADWEPIWLERMNRLCAEDRPNLESRDPDRAAVDNNYAAADFEEQRTLFREGRSRLLQRLHSLTDAEWERSGTIADWGPMTVSQFSALILGHDGYHTRQVAEWLVLCRR